MMVLKTFTQFITEEFAFSVQANFGYCEVFKNPSPKEWRACKAEFQVRKDVISVAAILTATDLYIWDRTASGHLRIIQEMQDTLKIPRDQMMAVYIDLDPKTRTMTTIMRSPTKNETPWDSTANEWIANHPQIRGKYTTGQIFGTFD